MLNPVCIIARSISLFIILRHTSAKAMNKIRIPSIYAEMTPNPMTMKFVADYMLLPDGVQLEIMSAGAAGESPLALELFRMPFVKGVYIAANFVTVLKNDKASWNDVAFDVRDFIKDFIGSGGKIWNPSAPKASDDLQNNRTTAPEQFVSHAEPANSSEQKIIDAIEEHIKPAVESDGGLILFRSFKDGVVTLQLKGSCNGCPSSAITLKAGVEQLLKRVVPEVTEVIQEM